MGVCPGEQEACGLWLCYNGSWIQYIAPGDECPSPCHCVAPWWPCNEDNVDDLKPGLCCAATTTAAPTTTPAP